MLFLYLLLNICTLDLAALTFAADFPLYSNFINVRLRNLGTAKKSSHKSKHRNFESTYIGLGEKD